MRRENLMARMLRALAGTTQEQMAKTLDVPPSLIAQIELDEVAPSPGQLETMAHQADLTVAGAEELLGHYDALCRSSRWQDHGFEESLESLKAVMRDHLARGFEELDAMFAAQEAAEEAERQRAEELAEELWARLETYPEATRLEMVEASAEFQNEALASKIVLLWIEELDGDPERAAGLKRLFERIRELAPKPEPPT